MKVFNLDNNSYEEVSSLNNFRITNSTLVKDGIRCAVLINKNNTFCYPWDLIKPINVSGENNVSAKFSNKEVVEMFLDFKNDGISKEKVKKYATKHKVSNKTIYDIINRKTWRKVTSEAIENKSPNKNCLAGTNSSKRKLSPSIATFVYRDFHVHKIPTAKLATKYCVSIRTIQRIVYNKSWNKYTKNLNNQLTLWKE